MKIYARVSGGNVVGVTSCEGVDYDALKEYYQLDQFIEIPEFKGCSELLFDGENVVDRPTQPTPHHIFNYTTKQWEDPRTLDDLKAAQWGQIKTARTQAEYAGFLWDGSTFDSDPTSQNRITGTVTLANLAKQLNQPYEITWTLADNSTRTLSANEMLLVGLALGQHVQSNFNKGQQLYKQIQQATTKEEVDGIVW